MAIDRDVFRTAQPLRLDYTKVKRQTRTAASVAKASSALPTDFVELTAPISPQGCG